MTKLPYSPILILILIIPAAGMGWLVSKDDSLGPHFSQEPIRETDDEDETNGHDEGEKKYDPLFVDWPDPQVAIFVSGRQHGYIEPCGCTGLDRVKGGMMRRHTLQTQLKDRGWNLACFDAGNQIGRFGIQANIKMATTFECLCQVMDYKAIGFGPDDLKMPVIDLIQIMENNKGEENPFVIANLVIYDQHFTERFRIVESGGRKIGVTTILGDEHVAALPDSGDIHTQGVNESLEEVIPMIREKGPDFMVLISHASLERSRELANLFPVFDLIITTGGSGDPTMLPEQIRDPDSAHLTNMIQVGVKGMYVGVVGLYDDEQQPIRYQRVPLDARFEDSPAIKESFISYQNQLESLGLEGLGLHAIEHPTKRTYVGSDACYDCHDYAYYIWKEGHDGKGGEVGPHWRATLDLTDPGERTFVTRQFDPECLSCHVTGWNPQGYFPYESGFLSEADELLHGNGCENCHGPGSRHVAIENGDIDATEAERLEAVAEMVLTLKEAREEKCMECHDLDNSPDFHEKGAFDRYWEKIKHYEDE